MKRIFLKRMLKIMSLILVVMIIGGLSQKYLFVHMDGNKTRIDGFYLEDKNTLDVVLMGSSEVFAGYSAGQAFKEFGYTSYPFTVDSNSITMIKSQIREIYQYQKPKLLVIEINGALYDDDSKIAEEATIRRYTDNMPWSLNKINTIMNEVDYSDKISFLFPIVKYHSNWTDYKGCVLNAKKIMTMETRGYSLLKGAFTYTAIDQNEKVISTKDIDEKLELTEKSETHLRNILQYLHDEKIENVLFVRFPHKISSDDQYSIDRVKRCNYAGEIIREYGYEFMNFERDIECTGLKSEQHFYNTDHLNIYGQEIFTSFLGNIIQREYNIGPSNLTERQKQEWQECVEYTDLYYDYSKKCIEEGKEEWLSESPSLIKKIQITE